MPKNPSTDSQHQNQNQLPTDGNEPTSVASREAADLGFAEALTVLRGGVDDSYGDRIHAGAAVLRATDDLDIETDLLTHPRVEQAIWRYEHDPDTIRQQIELTIEREEATATVGEVVAAFRIAAVRLDTPIVTG